jgi:hypothetical protein
MHCSRAVIILHLSETSFFVPLKDGVKGISDNGCTWMFDKFDLVEPSRGCNGGGVNLN